MNNRAHSLCRVISSDFHLKKLRACLHASWRVWRYHLPLDRVSAQRSLAACLLGCAFQQSCGAQQEASCGANLFRHRAHCCLAGARALKKWRADSNAVIYDWQLFFFFSLKYEQKLKRRILPVLYMMSLETCLQKRILPAPYAMSLEICFPLGLHSCVKKRY